MIIIDQNEIYKKIYYKYILLIGNNASHLKPWAKNQGFRVLDFINIYF